MNKTIFKALFAGAMSLTSAGCKKHDEATPVAMGSGSATMTGSASAGSGSAAMTGSATAMGSAAMGSAATGSAAEVPTTADFETQAATDITDKNLDTQLDKMEKDLGK